MRQIGLRTALIFALAVLVGLLILGNVRAAAPRPNGGVCAGLLGDMNLDGNVNILDFSIFALAYGAERGQGNYNPLADLTRDSQVNDLDFAVFKVMYGQGAAR